MIHPGEIGVCQTPSAVSPNLSSALIKNEDCIEDQDSQRRIYLLSLLLQRFLHPIFASAQVSYLMRPRRKFLKAGAVPCAVHFMWPRHQQVWIRATEDRRALTAPGPAPAARWSQWLVSQGGAQGTWHVAVHPPAATCVETDLAKTRRRLARRAKKMFFKQLWGW